MRVVYVQGVVTRTARRILVFVNVAEFRTAEAAAPSNRRLIKAATARRDVAKKWVGT